MSWSEYMKQHGKEEYAVFEEANRREPHVRINGKQWIPATDLIEAQRKFDEELARARRDTERLDCLIRRAERVTNGPGKTALILGAWQVDDEGLRAAIDAEMKEK